jgi:hypothetical protein
LPRSATNAIFPPRSDRPSLLSLTGHPSCRAISQVAPGAHAVLICDGAGWHAKSKDIVVPSNITLITLPGYAPELNAMENVWEYLRANRLGAQVWKTYTEIVRACANAWNWFVSDAPRIASIGARKWVIL